MSSRLLAALVLLVLAGCNTQKPPLRPAFRMPYPNKDEVMVVDGRALSIRGFEIFRAEFRGNALWAAEAALSLQNDTRLRGHEISVPSALQVVRYALDQVPRQESVTALGDYLGPGTPAPSPAEIHSRLDGLIGKALIQVNQRLIESIP